MAMVMVMVVLLLSNIVRLCSFPSAVLVHILLSRFTLPNGYLVFSTL